MCINRSIHPVSFTVSSLMGPQCSSSWPHAYTFPHRCSPLLPPHPFSSKSPNCSSYCSVGTDAWQIWSWLGGLVLATRTAFSSFGGGQRGQKGPQIESCMWLCVLLTHWCWAQYGLWSWLPGFESWPCCLLGACAQSCLTLHDLTNHSPGSSIHGISQARVLEWVAISFSRESSQPRDWICISYTAAGFFTGDPGQINFSVPHFPHL